MRRLGSTFAAGLAALAVSLIGAAASGAAFPPGDNGLIAYNTFTSPGNADIVVVGADGSNPVNITPGSAVNDLNPSFSPDGSLIAFDREDGGDIDIFVMGADGSNPTNLTPGSPGAEFDPAFSPDGTKIAFDSNGQVSVMPAAGGAPTSLTQGAGGESPTWSPDGSRIAFDRFSGGDWDVFAMDSADGGNVANLTAASTDFDADPAYSPDGSKIAFESTRDGGQDLFIAAPDGSNATNAAPGGPYEQQAVFSPDGTRIAFGTGVGMGVPDLFATDLDGANPVNLTQTPTSGEGAPDWQRLEPPDTDPPETEITKGPKKKTKKRRAKFEFSSDEPGSTFECKLDKGDFEPCDPAAAFKVKRRRHTLEVRAVDTAGNADPTPDSQSWKVKRKKKK